MSAEIDASATSWAGIEDIPLPETYTPPLFPRNDSERAARFAEYLAGDFRYVSSWKSWLEWNGSRWERDRSDAIVRKAQKMPDLLLREAIEIPHLEDKKKAIAAAIQAGNAAKLNPMIDLAGAHTQTAAEPSIFDADPYMLGLKNGVIDLRTGAFRETRKEDYITNQAGVEFVRGASCPLWTGFLCEIFQSNNELIEFIQRAVGYCLTGLTREQVLFFLYGTGRNGKSTFAEILLALLGSYAQHAPAALFVADRHGREPEKEIARLHGSRLVVGSEIEEGSRLAESRVKDLTGQDTLTGRFLYSHAFDFKPTHKLWIFGNHKPDISGSDLGVWRRISLIPFTFQVPEDRIDRELLPKLMKELPGILNWAIEGCLAWQQKGLDMPEIVRAATAEYREEEDELGEFIDQKCIVAPGSSVTRGDLHRDYLDWAVVRGIKMPLKAKAFAKRMRTRPGIGEGKSGVQIWTGLALKDLD